MSTSKGLPYYPIGLKQAPITVINREKSTNLSNLPGLSGLVGLPIRPDKSVYSNRNNIIKKTDKKPAAIKKKKITISEYNQRCITRILNIQKVLADVETKIKDKFSQRTFNILFYREDSTKKNNPPLKPSVGIINIDDKQKKLLSNLFCEILSVRNLLYQELSYNSDIKDFLQNNYKDKIPLLLNRSKYQLTDKEFKALYEKHFTISSFNIFEHDQEFIPIFDFILDNSSILFHDSILLNTNIKIELQKCNEDSRLDGFKQYMEQKLGKEFTGIEIIPTDNLNEKYHSYNELAKNGVYILNLGTHINMKARKLVDEQVLYEYDISVLRRNPDARLTPYSHEIGLFYIEPFSIMKMDRNFLDTFDFKFINSTDVKVERFSTESIIKDDEEMAPSLKTKVEMDYFKSMNMRLHAKFLYGVLVVLY